MNPIYLLLIAIVLLIYAFWPRAKKEQTELSSLPDHYKPIENTEEGYLYLQIADCYCPDCGHVTDWHKGPEGGMSTNIVCDGGHWFNVTPMIGTAERIKR